MAEFSATQYMNRAAKPSWGKNFVAEGLLPLGINLAVIEYTLWYIPTHRETEKLLDVAGEQDSSIVKHGCHAVTPFAARSRLDST